MKRKMFSGVLGRSLLWALGISLLVLLVMPAISGSNLGPIAGFVWALLSFCASLVIFLAVETLLALRPGSNRKKAYLLLLFIGITATAAVLFTEIGDGDFSRAGRMEHAAKLTEEERDLLEAFRLNLRVGVKNPRIPPVYTGKLISDLKETCLFAEVVDIAELPEVDVVATIKGGFYDNQEGQHFILHIPEKPQNGVYIRVFYSSSWWGKRSEHDQYMERLAVELLKAAQELFTEGHLNTSNPIFVQRVNDVGCRN